MKDKTYVINELKQSYVIYLLLLLQLETCYKNG